MVGDILRRVADRIEHDHIVCLEDAMTGSYRCSAPCGACEARALRKLADMVDEEAAKACEACREEMAGRLMPEGLSWPIVDGQPVDFVTGYEPSLGVLEAVSIYSNGACEVMSHDGIIKGVKEIHVEKPKVLDADGVEIHVGETVWRDDGEMLEVLYLRPDGLVDCCGEIERPERLTHERPESWERLEHDAEKTVCEYFGANYDCANCPLEPARCDEEAKKDIIRRAKKLAEKGEQQ